MVETILSALAPIVFTLLLGFVAAWRHDFGPKEASVLNRMVLLYAVPLALFVGTVGTPRTDLVQDIAFVVAIFVAIVGFYVLVFLLFHFVFRFSLSESVLAALTASAPAVPFMGPAILGDLFGKASAVTIAIAALVINLIVVPITILGLALGRTPVATTASATTRHSAFAEKLLETVKQPIVWAPVLAFVLVLCNVRVPSIVDHGLSLLGQATSGVALFASGIMLAAYKIQIDRTALSLALLKNIVQPALVLVGLRSLGYGAPIVPEAVLTTAIPSMPIVIVLAVQYHVSRSARLLCPISQRDWFDLHNRSFHRPDTVSDFSGRRLAMTQVEALAKYAARASFADLSAQSRKQLPVHILDSLGCCIAALGAGPVEACRAQVADFGGDGPCALIGGGNANPIFAAFWHTALVRYVDFMDNFLAPTETCHTADNFGVALTIADYVGGSGRDLMLAVALAYTVQSRFVDHANFMTRGFDHTAQLAFSLNAAAGRLLGLSEPQIANAIAMAAVSDASFAVVRAKPLSQWKGLASAQSALGAMNTLFLARRGVEGPLQVIEGPNGIDNLLHMQIRIDWDKQGYEGVLESTIKKYNSMIHTQSAVHCMVELVRQNKLDPGKVVSIEADVIRIAYDFAGGGLYGVDKVIRTKEQADHSLPYLLAVALLDGDVMPAQFAPDRIMRADVQQLLKKVSVRPDQEFTEQYPAKMPAKITVRLQDGKVIEHEVQDFPGLASRPFTWEDSVEKFDRLVAGRVDEGLCSRDQGCRAFARKHPG